LAKLPNKLAKTKGNNRSDGNRRKVFYDEDVEEAFTFRDSKNNKVDDVIEILSSDDELVIPKSNPKSKPKVSTEVELRRKKVLIEFAEAEIINSIVEHEIRTFLDSELFYSDLDIPNSPDISIQDEPEVTSNDVCTLPRILPVQIKSRLKSEIIEVNYTDVVNCVAARIVKSIGNEILILAKMKSKIAGQVIRVISNEGN